MGQSGKLKCQLVPDKGSLAAEFHDQQSKSDKKQASQKPEAVREEERFFPFDLEDFCQGKAEDAEHPKKEKIGLCEHDICRRHDFQSWEEDGQAGRSLENGSAADDQKGPHGIPQDQIYNTGMNKGGKDVDILSLHGNQPAQPQNDQAL